MICFKLLFKNLTAETRKSNVVVMIGNCQTDSRNGYGIHSYS